MTTTRLPHIAAIAAALFALAACAAEPPAADPNTSTSPTPTPSLSEPQLREPAWTLDLGVDSWAVPAIWGDRALIATTDNRIVAVNHADGSIAWEYGASSGTIGAPAINANTAYVVTDGGTVVALSDGGSPVWTTDIGAPATRGTYDNYGSRPVVHDGVVYAASLSGAVAALDQATGDVLWTYAHPGQIQSNLALGDGRLHVSAMNDRHVALDASTGELLWELNTLGEATTSPLVMGDKVIIGSRSAALQIRDAATGDRVWTASFGGSWVQSGAADIDGSSFAIGSSDLGTVRAYGIDEGRLLWNVVLGGWPWGVPASDGDVVYATNLRLDYQQPWEQAVFALDAQTGDLLWFAEGAPSLNWNPDGYNAYGAGAGPALTDDHVLVVMLDGTVRAYAR